MYCFQQDRQFAATPAPAVFLVLAAALALFGCGAGDDGDKAEASQAAAADSAATDATKSDSAAVDSTAKKVADAVPVETVPAGRGDISSFLLFSSTIETEAAVEIHPEVSGPVEQVLVEEGDLVEAGQLLVRLDAEQAHLEDRESQMELTHLEGAFQRTEEMHNRKLISAQEFEDKLYQLEQARLRREKARLALAYTEIRAPFSGVITSRQVQVGARVAPGAKLFDLVKLDDMIARVHVPGRYLRAVRMGQSAEIASDFIEGVTFPAYVKRISPIVDPKSGTFKVTIGLHDRWENLRPGIFVTVRVVTDTHRDAVLVPKEAIVYDGSDRFVFVVSDSTARRVPLDMGYENAEYVESVSAIAANTPVIVVGQNGLKDQARVKVVNAAAGAAPPQG